MPIDTTTKTYLLCAYDKEKKCEYETSVQAIDLSKAIEAFVKDAKGNGFNKLTKMRLIRVQ